MYLWTEGEKRQQASSVPQRYTQVSRPKNYSINQEINGNSIQILSSNSIYSDRSASVASRLFWSFSQQQRMVLVGVGRRDGEAE